MNADRLLELYEQISEAPDAIARLRRFVLDLAVRGKLVEQDAADGTGSDSLKKVENERTTLIKDKKIKNVKVDPILPTDYPFDAPFNWVWTRLGNIGDWGAGSTPSRGNADLYGGPITWLKSGELNDNLTLSGSEETVTELAVQKGSFRLNKPGDVLIAMYGATIGKLAILVEEAVTNQAVCGCTVFPGVFNRYLFLFLLSHRSQFHGASEGGAQPNISKIKIVNTAFALPPLAEQHRIVAKVDELMALCDRLEETRKTREETRDKLTAASLSRLTAPDTPPEDFPAHARFVLDALPLLTSRPDQIKSLRQTILNLAVCGKLVAQDPADEPASELLARIEETPKSSVRGRAQAPEGETTSPDCTIPESWIWTKFGALPIEIRVGLDRGKQKQGDDLEFGYFKMNNIGNQGGMDITILSRIDASEDEVRNFQLHDGDFLFNTRNSRELVGKTCVYKQRSPDIVLYNNNILKAKFSSDVCPDFIDIWFRSPAGRELAEGLKSNTTNVCAIYQGKLLSYLVPLPPLAEQRRIVAKVNALTALCDQMEAALTTADTTRTRLLEALLHEALNPSEKELEAAE